MQVQHVFLFGERKSFPHKPAEPLSDCIVEPLNMGGLPRFLPHLFVGGLGDAVVRPPKITETVAAQVTVRQFAPEPFAGLHAAVPDKKRNDLAVLTVQRYPYPYLVDFQEYKREHFVNFQYGGIPFHGNYGRFESREGPCFFFKILNTVTWLMPNIRPTER